MSLIERFSENPLLTPSDVEPTSSELDVLCTLNPAAVRFRDEILLLVRVGQRTPPESGYVSYVYADLQRGGHAVGRIREDDPDLELPDGRTYFYRERMLLSSISHLRIARSRDGKHFTFDPEPAIEPSTPYEAYGCEDARITLIGDRYFICYTAVSSRGVCVAMASTTDFRTFEKHGIIFPPYQKDVCIFPQKVRRKYVCRHRPYKNEFNPASIWTAYSPDLECWGRHEMTHAPVPNTWESERVGCGAPPVLTREGWLEVYHASDHRGRYCLGAMLSDAEHPERVISRSAKPIMEPKTDYEIEGVFSNCIFHNGWVVDDDGVVLLYYGAGDHVCAGAKTHVDELLQAAKNES